MKKILILFILFFTHNLIFGQTISDVDAYQDGKNIIITYTFENNSGNSNIPVQVSCSVDGGKSFYQLTSLSGDLKVTNSGTGKRVVWNVLNDVDAFVYDNVVFKVETKGVVANSQANEYYKKGMECEKNKRYADAIKYYRLAAQQGHTAAKERITAIQLYFW